jgi:ankyrin repeat protein
MADASVVGKEKANGSEDDVVPAAVICVICLESLESPTTTLPCGHQFCSDCFEGWRSKYSHLELSKGCPQCRRTVPPTKQMLSQLACKRTIRSVVLALLDQMETPYVIPPPSPYYDGGGHPLDRQLVDLLPPGCLRQIRSLPSQDMQQEALKEALVSRLNEVDMEIQEMEDMIGDIDPCDLLDESGGVKYDELPEEIALAAINDDVERVLAWLGDPPIPRQKINATTADDSHSCLLHLAEYAGSAGLATMLLQLGAEVDPKSTLGTTPLYTSCFMEHHFHVSEVLLQWGASKEIRVSTSAGIESPLSVAMASENMKLASLLLSPLGGRRCEIVGLQQRSNLNGSTCIAGRYLGTVDQYEVRVETTKEAIKVRSANLKRCDKTHTNPGFTVQYMGRDPRTGSHIYRPRVSPDIIQEMDRGHLHDTLEQQTEMTSSEVQSLDTQEKAMKQASVSHLNGVEMDIQEIGELIGDANPHQLLDESSRAMYDELPVEIALAAMNEDVERVLAWLGDPPIPRQKINARSKDDSTLLHLAEYAGSTEFATMLLLLGAEVDPKSASGTTPFYQACVNDHPYVAMALLQWGASKDIRVSSATGTVSPLSIAMAKGNMEFASLLQSPLGFRRCQIVGLQQRPDLNGLMCIAGKYLDTVDRYEATVQKTKEAIRVRSANLKRCDRTHTNPGMIVEYMGRDPRTGAHIYNSCLSPDIIQEMDGGPLRDTLEQQMERTSSEVLPSVIKRAVAVNDIKAVLEWLDNSPPPVERINGARTPEDLTVLHLVGHSQSQHLLSILLQFGAYVDPQTRQGVTPLYVALLSPGALEVGKVFLEWGARTDYLAPSVMPNHKPEEAHAPGIAKAHGNMELARLMSTTLGGRRCQLVGLKSRSDLNGMTCIVGRQFKQTGRYQVTMEVTEEALSIKGGNLKRKDRTKEDPGVVISYTGKDPETGEHQCDLTVLAFKPSKS